MRGPLRHHSSFFNTIEKKLLNSNISNILIFLDIFLDLFTTFSIHITMCYGSPQPLCIACYVTFWSPPSQLPTM